MKYYIIAGEASGDLHASNLMRAIKVKDPEATFRCWGGDKMHNEGADLVKHYKDLAFMGFAEVLMNIRTITKNLNFCKDDLLNYNPDALILVDYPGFNLRIAEFAHKNQFKVYYYISPQVWAWKKSRVYTIKKVVDRLFVILPFEKDFYAKYDYDVSYVGHPLLDVIPDNPDAIPDENFFEENKLDNRPIIAILPGSRKQEITKILPLMLSVFENYKNEYQCIISGVKSIDQNIYTDIIGSKPVKILYGQTYNLFRNAHIAAVTSGTASLEAALFRVPQVICYKGGAVSYAIAKRIVDIKYIGLPNLIMNKLLVTELIQNELTKENLILEFDKLLKNKEERQRIITDYIELRKQLGGSGASERTAAEIIEHLKNSPSFDSVLQPNS
jgi:lipid-A-disaccharide synthase